MTDFNYTPAFDPEDWTDNVDRITGDGPRGLNVRFDTISGDLRQAAAVVGRIDAALGQPLGGTTGQQLLTPGLDFVPLPGGGSGPWKYDNTGALHPPGGSGGSGAVMGLSLPPDIRLVSFRVIGLYAGSPVGLFVSLLRAPLADVTATAVKLAEVSTATAALTNPYDVTVPVDTALGAVDPGTYRYFVMATENYVSDPTLTSVSTVQLGYVAA